MAAVPLLISGVAGAAIADDIANNLDGSVDASAEVMALNVGASGSTTLDLIERNADGKNGCNLTGSTVLRISIESSNTAVATVSPSSITFTSCGDLPSVNVLGVAEGTATISATETANTSGGSFDLAPATFTVNVTDAAPANSAPTVSVSGVTAGASYNKGAVPAAMCDVIDKEDGNSSFAAALSAITGPYAADGIGSQTATCSYTDAGGINAAGSVTYNIIDSTPPVIGYTLTPGTSDGLDGWYTGQVTLTWNVTENESPSSLSKTGCVNQDITADQFSTDYTCSATSAGGTATQQTVSIKRDGTAPTVNLVGGPPATYYYGSDPAAPTCEASDATSGLASCVVSGGGTAVGVHTYTATAKDNAGNPSTAELKYTVVAWTLKGFYSPVDMNGVWNTVKGGSTVPLKFEVFAGSTELTSTSAVKSFTTKQVNCDGGSSLTDDIEITSTGGTSLRYDATGGQFIQNWATPKKPGTCYSATMTTQDGSSITALFKLK